MDVPLSDPASHPPGAPQKSGLACGILVAAGILLCWLGLASLLVAGLVSLPLAPLPAAFGGMLGYLVALDAPNHPLLPSHWITQVALSYLLDTSGSPLFHAGMLWSTAAAFWVLGGWWAQAVCGGGWSRNREGRRPVFSRSRLAEKGVGILVKPFPSRIRN